MQEDTANHRSWHKLDNTANLFPVITNKRFSNVYRLSITISEDVEPELLQKALVDVLPHFTAFRVQIRRGLFWHYLEHNDANPVVYEEDEYPGAYIDPDRNNRFLFRVSYFKNRINLEVYHVLSDGTGAFRLLQAMCCRYLMLAHPAAFSEENKKRHWFAEHGSNTEDSYLANYTPAKKSSFNIGRGFKLKGDRFNAAPVSLIHAHMQVGEILALCRQKQVSITHYITASIGWTIFNCQLHGMAPKHPINIFIPINLRNMFVSNTSLNFFSNIYVSLDFKKENITFDDVLLDVKQQFEEKTKKENVLEKLSYTVGGGHNPFIRIVPLPIKMLVLRWIFSASAKSGTTSFSNTGQIKFPEVFQPYVLGAITMLSCVQSEPFKCAAASYGDVLTLSFSSLLHSTALQRDLIRQFADDGLEVVVESNGVDYEKM